MMIASSRSPGRCTASIGTPSSVTSVRAFGTGPVIYPLCVTGHGDRPAPADAMTGPAGAVTGPARARRREPHVKASAVEVAREDWHADPRFHHPGRPRTAR